jgi:hypothetical protein
MTDSNPNTDQDSRRGGYGDSTGGRNPEPQQEESGSSGAAGRDGAVDSPLDADEALGNRSGGYGSSATEPSGEHRDS